MAAVIQLEEVSKSFSAEVLLEGISCTIQDKQRVGMIGPNGAGKSTLLKIMQGAIEPDNGTLRRSRDTHFLYTSQQCSFSAGERVADYLASAWTITLEDYEREARSDRYLRALDIDPDVQMSTLSGGWQKRVQLIAALMQEPDCWLLDEPTNHLDLDAVLWLQEELRALRGTLVMISHDRYFLNEICDRIIDVNRCYKDGLLDCSGNYDRYLEQRDAYMESQRRAQSSLANEHKREQAWLARRPKARTTKAVSRIKRAADIAEDLEAVQQRNQQRRLGDVSFHGSGRRSQDLLKAEGLAQAYADTCVFKNLDLQLSAGDRLVILGANGSGKTSLLDVLAGTATAKSGTLKQAHELRIVRFSQDRSQLNQKATLKQVICPDGDQVVYQGRAIHINGWLQLFLFTPEQLDQRISAFSGGEQARILLSQMMLREADVLILDEPTNDLDIPSIELLEQNLIDFNGAVVLVTHDRYLMEEVGTRFLAMELGQEPRRVGSYRQWEAQQLHQGDHERCAADQDTQQPLQALSWEEQKELRGMEKRVLKAEADLEALSAQLGEEATGRDAELFADLTTRFEVQQQLVEELYTRWQDLEERNA